MYCPRCGKETGPDSRFCRNCGASLVDEDAATEVQPRSDDWPQPESAETREFTPSAGASPPPVNPPSRMGGAMEVPRWALLAGGAVLAALVVAGGVILLTGGSDPKFVGKANELIAPVRAADAFLDTKLQASDQDDDLSDVAEAASQLVQELTRAQGALSVLSAEGSDGEAKVLLNQAFIANLSYAEKVESAAKGLNTVRASAASTAGQQAAQAFTAVAATEPKLIVPENGLFLSATQLQALAAERAKAAQARVASANSMRTYVRSIDGLLRSSAETKTNLGLLIDDIRNGQLSPSQATSQIASIINQRQDLQNQVSAVPAPPAFRAAADRLRASIKAALDDDYAIQGWITAWFDNDAYAFDRAFSRHEEATARASTAKAGFLALYNRLRARYLKLPPLDVSY
jgi:hypothetical protein